MNSVNVFIVCLPIIIIASCMHSSVKQPPKPHCNQQIVGIVRKYLPHLGFTFKCKDIL